jgi:predicted TIM-barrel fold metal-dependent hydrolase
VKPTNEDARRLARETNEYGARLVSDYKGRFGIWASLALPDIDGSLKEIEYALDTLKLQGIGLMTSFGNHWMGDPMFTPVFEELNRRKAVVYTHPTAAPCCRDLIPDLRESMIEYNTDTTRTIMSWIVSGSAKRFPDVMFIFSHGGGTLPYLASRLDLDLDRPVEPDSRLHYVRKFYYDTCASGNAATLAALKKVVGASQVVFGTDYPYGQDPEARYREVADTGEFTAAELRAIDRENALRILPQYA